MTEDQKEVCGILYGFESTLDDLYGQVLFDPKLEKTKFDARDKESVIYYLKSLTSIQQALHEMKLARILFSQGR